MRADLLALTDDSLASLANRGIVKRAVKEVAEGKGPTVTVTETDDVVGEFADGTTVKLPAGITLEKAQCTCPASGVCRHRVMTVIAYRDSAPADEWVAWSPADFSDDDLLTLLGNRVLALARRTFRSGYRARVRRPTSVDPVPTVELSSCTVRFLVPSELGYARVDAAGATREDALALAVWAYRVADEVDVAASTVDVAVGGGTAETVGVIDTGIEPLLPLLSDLLADGVVNTSTTIHASFAQARRALDYRNLRWPVDALDEIVDLIDAYRTRSARHHPEAVAALLAEIVARHRCVGGRGASLRPDVLGTEEAAETPLRLLRMVGLGARVQGDESTRLVEIYLAHIEAGVVLTVRRRIDVAEGETLAPEELGRRRAGGARISALAEGNVVTESAVRAANRVVRIAESRVGRTTIAPSSGAWQVLPPSILVHDLDAEAQRIAALPPALVRPRIVAESVRAIAIAQVDDIHYRPGAQQLVAVVHAPTGRATVSLAHTSATGGAVDALAHALSGELGPVRFVAGHLRRHGGEVIIEPTAVVAGERVVVPAFAATSTTVIPSGAADLTDPLASALSDALALAAEVAHRGWRHLPPSWAARTERTADQLRRVGLAKSAQSLLELRTAIRAEFTEHSLDHWADSTIRLLVTAEQL